MTKEALDEGLLLPSTDKEQTFSSTDAVAGDSCVGRPQDLSNAEEKDSAKEKDQTNRELQQGPDTAAAPESEASAGSLAVLDRFGDLFIFFVLIYVFVKWLSESEFRYDFL